MSREDTASADAGALIADDSAGKTFDITGPQALTAHDIWRALSDVSGKKLDLVILEPPQLAEQLLKTGSHPETAPVIAMMADAIRGGCYDGVSDAPDLLAGHPRKTLAEWLERALPVVLARSPRGPWE